MNLPRKRASKNSYLDEPAFEDSICFDTGHSILGDILVAMGGSGIVAILIGDGIDPLIQNLQKRFPTASLYPERLDSGDIVAQVAQYIQKPQGILDLPLELRGTPFQQSVWNAVRKVPAGKTSTYSEIARQIKAPKAVRAVGSACAANNLAFAVPCHRILHKDGSMSWGESWGKTRQKQLLAMESNPQPKTKSPKKSQQTPSTLTRNPNQPPATPKTRKP